MRLETEVETGSCMTLYSGLERFLNGQYWKGNASVAITLSLVLVRVMMAWPVMATGES